MTTNRSDAAGAVDEVSGLRTAGRLPRWTPYVVPMAVFLLLTLAEGQVPVGWYVWLYGAKVLLVSGALWAFRGAWREEIKPDTRGVLLAILVGLAVFAEWVLLDKWVAYPHLGARTAFDPFVAIVNPVLRYGFLGLRFYGLALLVPLMEELFWRSFLLRWVTDPDDFTRVPLGRYSMMAFWIVAGLFASAHPEWLVALVCAGAYALLLRRTGSLFACIVAHGVTNLALGVYVVVTGDWKYW